MGALNTILAIIVVLAIVAILAVTVGVVLNNLPDSVKNVGAKQTQTPLFEGNELAGRIASAIGMPGAPDKLTVENLIIFIAIFVIMALALTEIIMMFSTFSTVTSWIIGFAITLIAGATGMISLIAAVFGITAGIGAVGIAIIIIASIVAAMVVNIGIGQFVKQWAFEKGVFAGRLKTRKGFEEAGEGLEGMQLLAKIAGGGKGK